MWCGPVTRTPGWKPTFPNYGWVAFDPTPGRVDPDPTGWSRVSLYVDAMASFWREWVVNYDAGHQQSLAVNASGRSRNLLRPLRRWWHRHYEDAADRARHTGSTVSGSPLRWALEAELIVVVLLFVVSAPRLLQALGRSRLAARPERSPRRAATIWYERMTNTIARRGWHKSPAQTPDEFVAWIDDPRHAPRVAKFTRHYESARFDDSAEDARRLPELYEEIASTRHR